MQLIYTQNHQDYFKLYYVCNELNVYVSENLYIEILTCKVMLLEVRPLGGNEVMRAEPL